MSNRRPSQEVIAADAGSQQSQRRPASIAELAERALDSLWDESRDLKHYLRIAEKYRKEGKDAFKSGDLEAAFVFLARAATLVLEKIPTHRDYNVLLTDSQRSNLGLNGQDILDNLSNLKPILVTRFNDWRTVHPDIPLEEFDRGQERRQEQERIAAEDMARWKQQHEGIQRREEESRQRQPARHHQHQQLDRRKDDAITSARQAAGTPAYQPPSADFSFSRPQNLSHGSQSTIVVMPDGLLRQEKLRQEQEGIQRRQQEAEAEARQMRQVIAVNNILPNGQVLSATPSSSSMPISPMSAHTQRSSLTTPLTSSFYPPSIHTPHVVDPIPGTLRAPTAVHSRPQSQAFPFLDQYGNESGPILPGSNPIDLNRTPTRATLRSALPPPITTTSPPPTDARLLFPQLMSPHQQSQGYYPSLNSMFVPIEQLTLNDRPAANHSRTPSSLAFASQEAKRAAAAAAAAQVGKSMYESSGRWKPPPTSSLHQPNIPPARPPLPHLPIPPPPPSAPEIPTAGGRVPITTPGDRHNYGHSQMQSQNHSRSYPSSQTQPHRGPKLKTVTMPRECLPRFLAIAKVNTSMNRETCGLLLGREVFPDEESPPSYAHDSRSSGGRANGKGMGAREEGRGEYVVTTLLIPKQRGTSDMCTMDEEELVLSFTEERSLITLGWIHTHPSQSCFMSSVDLHTHSGFQKMLPESFAVVCAPKSSPNFGIFRLTDPPGLNTILECAEKEAFHPHPDLPIYTDADKGHVQMKDAPLEIIDLR